MTSALRRRNTDPPPRATKPPFNSGYTPENILEPLPDGKLYRSLVAVPLLSRDVFHALASSTWISGVPIPEHILFMASNMHEECSCSYTFP